MKTVLTIMLVLAAVWAAASDIRSRRIPNGLTLGAALAALAVRLGMGGEQALLSGGEGWLLGVGLLLAPFLAGAMGAGDVKLLALFGSLGGPLFVFWAALIACLIGGAMAVAYLVRQGRLLRTIRVLPLFLFHPALGVEEAGSWLPFGPALALGAGAAVMLAGGLK